MEKNNEENNDFDVLSFEGFPIPDAEKKSDIKEDFEQAKQLFSEGLAVIDDFRMNGSRSKVMLRKAGRLLFESLQNKRDYAPPYAYIAFIYANINEYDKAMEFLQAGEAIDRDDWHIDLVRNMINDNNHTEVDN